MKKITVVEDSKFVIKNETIEKIAITLRKVANEHGTELSEHLCKLTNAFYSNLYGLATNSGAKRYYWLINLMANGESIMNTISKDERYLFYEIMTEIQKMAGQNLANSSIGPHKNYWTSGMSEYSTLESDIFSYRFARFTLAYVRTYCEGGAIVIINDHATNIYRMGTSNNDQLFDWTHLEGGMNGFMAIKYYLSEKVRKNFVQMYAEYYKKEIGYIPCTDMLRNLSFVPTCHMVRLKACYNNKPTYKLV